MTKQEARTARCSSGSSSGKLTAIILPSSGHRHSDSFWSMNFDGVGQEGADSQMLAVDDSQVQVPVRCPCPHGALQLRDVLRLVQKLS